MYLKAIKGYLGPEDGQGNKIRIRIEDLAHNRRPCFCLACDNFDATSPFFHRGLHKMASLLSLLVMFLAASHQLSLTHSRKLYAPHLSAKHPPYHAHALANESQLAQELWESVGDLKEKAVEARFISGVSQGDLSPEFYGRYSVQDAIWCRELANLWQKLANDSVSPELQLLRQHAQNMSEAYYVYSVQMFQWWQIRSSPNASYGVYLGPEAQGYIDFIASSVTKGAVYMLIASYPCLKLWPYLGQYCAQNQPLHNNCTNVYLPWIDENKEEGDDVTRQAEVINYYAPSMNTTKAHELFRKGIDYETFFFNLTISTPSVAALGEPTKNQV